VTSAVSPSAGRPARAPRPSLSATVLRLTAVALVAAVLVWSVLFVDGLRKRSDAGATSGQTTGQLSSPDGGQSAQSPGPVVTRTS
jgi:hypothetical protein